MTTRKRIHASGPVGDLFSYSTVVRAGPHIWVSGAAPYDNNHQLVGPGLYYEQTLQTLENVRLSLASVDASLSDVVATRIYVLDAKSWPDVGKAFGEIFKTIRPAATMVEVCGLLGPGMLIEIEANAFIDRGD